MTCAQYNGRSCPKVSPEQPHRFNQTSRRLFFLIKFKLSKMRQSFKEEKKKEILTLKRVKREKKKGSYRDFKYNLFLIATLEINKSCRLFIYIKIKFCIF